ncbi:heparinase II/III domain-containing protein [Paenibacillus mesophilus]|uniref:heparinase II/III domain-containing protein n=1 Tax=Paenibacillus mesophilus TaxID=2582849 RepID=UPI00130547AA|nr:heparinase II/III family protein [Paenibacillus mesophilus]
MRKWLIWTIVLMLCVPVGLGDPEPALADTQSETGAPITMYSNKWTVLPQSQAAPVIDGALSDNVWSGAAALDDFRTAYYNEPVPDGPSYKMFYDSSNLYFGGSFATEDKAILEKVELVVSRQTYGEAHYVVTIPITPLAKATVTDWNIGRDIAKENPQRTKVNAFTSAMTDSGGRTSVEVSVPLSALGASAPAPGTEWRVNVVHVYHLNTKPLLSWIPLRTSNFWDTGSTVTIKGNLVDEGRMGSVFFGQTPVGQRWTPEEAELRYTGFTQKQLSFKRGSTVNPVQTKFSLKWKNPVGDWEPLTQVTSVKNGDRCTLTFEHPPALDFGLTELQIYAYRDDQPNDGRFAIVTFDRDSLIEAGLEWTGKAPPPAGTVQVQPAPASQQVVDTLELIPDKVGFIFTGLPEMPELHPLGLYKLSADNKSIVSLKTGTVYPNAQYPESNVVTAVNRKGETLEYPYYEDAEGKRYFLSAHLWYLQKDYATAQTEKIAKTDALGAARLLYRFAQVYEGYAPSTDYIWRNYPINITSGPPFNYWGGMWYRWSVADLNSLRPLLRAYNLVKKTNALELLSQEVGENIDKKLVEQMFIPSMQYALSYPYVLGNMNYTQWLGMIDAGKMLNEPDYIHNAFEWMQDYVETQFLSDGYWKEVAPSYHVQSTNGLDQAIAALDGYSDPAGYVSPRTGRRFDDLDMAKDYPIIERSLRDNNLLVYPDGKLLPIQDSWASDKAKSPILNAGSFLMPAAGIGRLAAGAGAGQSQLWLQFQPKYGHNHYDPLQLNLYAEGQELLPDLGYTYTKDRSFSLSTMGHNTVVVDSKDMKIDNVSKHGGKIDLFAPAGQVQVMRADQKEAYAGLDQYSREPWFVSFPGAQGGEGYVVDLFRVSGGSRHEYTLQGDANRDSVFVTDMALDPYGPYLLPPGTPVVEPEQFNDKGSAGGHYYGYISVKDVKKAQLPGDRYDLTLVTSEKGAEKAK